MEDSIGGVQSVSSGLGIAGFVVSLVSLILGAFIQMFLLLSIVGLILSVIQLKKKKTGFAVAGLVLGIIGIIFLLFSFVVAPILLNIMISDIDEQLSEGTSCIDVMMSVGIGSACNSDDGVEVNLNYGVKYVSGEINFIVDDSSVKKTSSLGVSSESFVLNLDAEAGEILEVAMIVNGKDCGVLSERTLVAC